jgi:hypothetical protein
VALAKEFIPVAEIEKIATREPKQRAAAAVSLGPALDDEGQDRLRVVANPAAAPRLRVLMEFVIDPVKVRRSQNADELAPEPDRMRLVAELLEAGVISRLDPATAKDIATQTRALAAEYAAVLAPARLPRTKPTMLDRVRGALARAGQIALARLRRLYKANGFSEAESHTLIPDRPTAKPHAKPKDPEPAKPV